MAEHPGLTLVFAETGIRGSTRFGGAGVFYARPIAVDLTGGATVPIRDHLMTVRLVVLALTLLAYLLGGRDDR